MSVDSRYVTEIPLLDGRVATVRPLQPSDVEPLTVFFTSLSPETRRYYGPHPFDRPTAERLCASIDESKTVRFVAVLDDGGEASQFIGYMILTREIGKSDIWRYGARLHQGKCACFAPGILDGYQNQGFGTQMARHVVDCAKEMGLRQIILMGGVVAVNARAQRLYEKLGFRRVGQFWTGEDKKKLNYDMALEL